MIDINTLKEYIKVLEDSSLSVLEVSDETDCIRMEKPTAEAPVAVFNANAASAQHCESSVQSASEKAVKAIKSPMVGMFYDSPAPEKPAFVSVGDKVSKGDVVCIIEAMKIMNEITAEESGTVAEILVNNGDTVEYDQPLFRLS